MAYLEKDLAYLAGLVDGEGTIGIAMRGEQNGKPQYRAYFDITNTDKTILQSFVDVFGQGHINKKQPREQTHKAIYHLRYNETRVPHVLKHLLPYLRAKKERAKILLEFIGRKANYKGSKQFVNRAELEQRAFFHALMKILNKRGV